MPPVRTPLPNPLSIDDLFALRSGGFILYGTANLSSGTYVISDHRIQASSIPLVSLIAPGGTMGANYKAACTLGALTITAVKTDKSTETSDTSTVSYLIIL